jgi:hypothetical protein
MRFQRSLHHQQPHQPIGLERSICSLTRFLLHHTTSREQKYAVRAYWALDAHYLAKIQNAEFISQVVLYNHEMSDTEREDVQYYSSEFERAMWYFPLTKQPKFPGSSSYSTGADFTFYSKRSRSSPYGKARQHRFVWDTSKWHLEEVRL